MIFFHCLGKVAEKQGKQKETDNPPHRGIQESCSEEGRDGNHWIINYEIVLVLFLYVYDLQIYLKLQETEYGRKVSRGEVWTATHKHANGEYVNDEARQIGVSY